MGPQLRSLTEQVFNVKSRALGTIDEIVFSPDGRVLAASHSSAVVKLWESRRDAKCVIWMVQRERFGNHPGC